MPKNLNCLYVVNSGTEANEAALKLAKRATKRSRIVSFKGAYHGSSHGSLSISGNETKKYAFIPLLPDVFHLPFNDTDAFGDTEVGVMRILDTTLSTSQNQLGDSLDIYPNPSSDRITVFGLKVQQITIYNSLGQLILEANNTNVLNVSSLLAGVYFIKITDGINFSTRKFIKK